MLNAAAAPPVITTLAQWFDRTLNPYPARDTLLNNYSAATAAAAQQLRDITDSTTHPMAFLAATSDSKPLVFLMPFSGGLPGTLTQDKYGLLGDLSASGQLPDIAKMPQAFLYLINVNVNCVSNDGMAAAWNADPAADLLDPNDQAAADGSIQSLTSRKTVPIPHELVANLIRRQDAGTLTWRSLWNEVIAPLVLTDPQKVTDYQTFLEYIRIASTKRPPAQQGDPERAPAPNLAFPLERIAPAIREQAMQRLRLFMPDLASPSGVGVQVQQLHQQFVQAQARLAQATAKTPDTLKSTYAPLYEMLTKVCETEDEKEFGTYWSRHVNRKAGEYRGLMTQALSATCRGLNIVPPMIQAAFATDIGTGAWVSADFNDIISGISIWRLRINMSDFADIVRDRNYEYDLVGHGAGVLQASATMLAVHNKEVDPPQDATQFRYYLQGYYGFLVCFFGTRSRMVKAYRDHVINKLNSIETGIEVTYRLDDQARRSAYLRVMTYIWRVTNRFVANVLSVDFQDIGTISPPTYEQIDLRLADGQVLSLTEIPPSLAAPVIRPPLLGGGGPPGPVVPTGGGARQQQGGGEPITMTSQNPDLKRGWSTLGIRAIFGEGSPFRDTSQPYNRRKVKRDAPNQEAVICLPMALTGKCYSNCSRSHEALTQAECERVARLGGFALA